jgi:hypothetical protein
MSTGGKGAMPESDHSPPPGAGVKNQRSYTSTPSACLHGMQRGTSLLHLTLKTENSESAFLSKAPRRPKGHYFLEGSQISPV